MNIKKHTILGVLNTPFRSLFLLITVTFLIFFLSIGIFIREVTNNYYLEFVRQEGYSFFVGTYSQGNAPPLNQDFIEETLKIDHVVGYNMSITLECFPQNFVNVPYQYSSILSAEENNGMIRLIGNQNTKLYDSFRNGHMKLISGSFPSTENPGALVDRVLASQNKLSLGDVIILDSNQKIPIIGIYETVVAPKINLDDYYAYASKSFIFCDLNTFGTISPLYDTYIHMDLYVEKYDYMSSVERQLSILCNQWSTSDVKYYYTNNIDNRVSIDSGFSAVVILSEIVQIVLGISYYLSLIILFLLTFLWVKDHFEDLGIYLILGKSIHESTYIIFLEMCFILFLAILVGGSITAKFLAKYSTAIIDFATTMSASSFGNVVQKYEAIKTTSCFTVTLKSIGSVLVIELLAYISSLFIAFKLNWRDLLSENRS